MAGIQKLEDYFVDRTGKHVEAVKDAAKKIVVKRSDLSELLANAESHDASKYEEPERLPYVYLTWKYNVSNNGVEPIEFPEGMEDRMVEATKHHVLNNKHHPEYWVEDKSQVEFSKKDRDAVENYLDVSAMPDIYLAEMVADWWAMSQELKKNTAREWYESKKDTRWKFSDHQQEFIEELLGILEWEEVSEGVRYSRRIKKLSESIGFDTEVLEYILKKGYELRKEKTRMQGDKDFFKMDSCYSPSGGFIGDEKSAKFFVKKGIVPEVAKPDHKVCSIGYCTKDGKWYGWSHRAMYGFGKGDKVYEERFGDDSTKFSKHGSKDVVTMKDSKQAAINFAESVS